MRTREYNFFSINKKTTAMMLVFLAFIPRTKFSFEMGSEYESRCHLRPRVMRDNSRILPFLFQALSQKSKPKATRAGTEPIFQTCRSQSKNSQIQDEAHSPHRPHRPRLPRDGTPSYFFTSCCSSTSLKE